MTAGIPGTGPWSRIKSLRYEIKIGKERLAAYPLGPIQRRRLEKEIKENQTKVKEILAQWRASRHQAVE